MSKRLLHALAFGASLTLVACGSGNFSAAVPPADTPSLTVAQNGLAASPASGDLQALCAPNPARKHHCLGYSLTTQGLKRLADENPLGIRRGYGGQDRRRFTGTPSSGFLPAGYGPSDFQQAYDIPSNATGGGRIVAVVESGDAPTLENDLNVYRAQYHLPLCTTANNCLRKIAQDGSARLPAYDPNWLGESQLDVEIISALCPACSILVVESNDEGNGLDIAENTAAQQGAFAISNSWGGTEDTAEAAYFYHPGVTITAASGDGGYHGGPQSPADFQTVIAVGGTTLTHASNPRGWSETAWSAGGAGCSKVIAKPAWQNDPGCSMRTIADMAFVGDPSTGVAMYDSNPRDAGNGPVGWRIAGGTSVGAPAVAALFTLADVIAPNAAHLYGVGSLNDVISGSDGTCAAAYLCNGEIGYDAPTGNGTPNGLSSL